MDGYYVTFWSLSRATPRLFCYHLVTHFQSEDNPKWIISGELLDTDEGFLYPVGRRAR